MQHCVMWSPLWMVPIMTDLDPDKIMAEHTPFTSSTGNELCSADLCSFGVSSDPWPCVPYLQAEDRKRLAAEVKTLRADIGDLDHALDRWRHGAPAALASLAERRMAALDGADTKVHPST